MISFAKKIPIQLKSEQIFMLSGLLVNAGNYAYNLILGRYLGPTEFADAAILITLLLVLSFVAMTYQLAVTKFTLEFDSESSVRFVKWMYRNAIILGVILGCGIVVFASDLQKLFHTVSSEMFTIFGCVIPLYFAMSVNRGRFQGNSNFVQLSGTYQFEMITRLVVTFFILFFFQISSSVGVAIGIAVSMIAGLFPFKSMAGFRKVKGKISAANQKRILSFLIISASYEGTLIICNNSDILLVKHFFEAYDAGLYASLALIGRVVYFITWMFVMLLLPKVIQYRKEGLNTIPILSKYLFYITLLCIAIVSFTFIFPDFAVRILFGEGFLEISPLLGWYALATGLFAISNVFAYYFLSLDHYRPILFAAVMGIVQIILILFFHNNLFEVVLMQITAMGVLLALQVGYFRRFAR
jgi:O-antigen/teichoic acid export membrane protein